jgi:hypothetical protein
MIPKSDLIDGAYYKGRCRNATVARWDGRRELFMHWRTKFGSTFLETIKHPEDETRFDVFVPECRLEPSSVGAPIPFDDHDYQQSVISMGETLTAVVNACRGEPPEDCSWSTHDAAYLAGKAAALANAFLAATAPNAGSEAVFALSRAVEDWRAIQADTVLQAVEMEQLRDNPEAMLGQDD